MASFVISVTMFSPRKSLDSQIHTIKTNTTIYSWIVWEEKSCYVNWRRCDDINHSSDNTIFSLKNYQTCRCQYQRLDKGLSLANIGSSFARVLASIRCVKKRSRTIESHQKWPAVDEASSSLLWWNASGMVGDLWGMTHINQNIDYCVIQLWLTKWSNVVQGGIGQPWDDVCSCASRRFIAHAIDSGSGQKIWAVDLEIKQAANICE